MAGLPALTTPELNALAALERQQRRRTEGRPTVSVLAGPVGLGMSLWRRWLRGHRRGVATGGDPGLDAATDTWVGWVLHQADLHWHAYRWLGEHVGMDAHEMQAKLERQPLPERQRYVGHALTSWPDGAVTLLAQWLLLQPAGPVRWLPWAEIFSAAPAAAAVRLRAVCALLPADTVPGLLLVSPGHPNDETWLDTAAQTTTTLAREVPALPLAVAVEAADWFHFLTGTTEAPARTVLRDGVVRCNGLTEETCKEYLAQTLPRLSGEERQRLDPALQSILRRGATAEILRAYAEAVQEVTSTDGPILAREAPHQSPCKAEQFLYLQLEAAPTTAGLFTPLPTPDASHPGAEGGLAATNLRVMVIVDRPGDLADPEVYRRDRQRDARLQQQGWLVRRFLAEDVVFRLEEVLTAIAESAAPRQG